MHLLIADDEKIIRDGLLRLDWKSIGIEKISVTDSGIEALKVFSELHPQIILTDIKMPGLDGLELAKEIHLSNVKCKLILLTGYGTFEYAKRALHSGVFEYLLKPSNPAEVLETVKRAKISIEIENRQQLELEMTRAKNEMLNSYNEEKNNIKLIMEYIEENYMNNISLTTLSEYTHFSSSYLSKLIKKETSYNFTKILSTMRMLKAAEFLLNTDLKIYIICEKIGMNDQRYFSQLFYKTFGKTPIEYRRSNANKEEANLMKFIKNMR